MHFLSHSDDIWETELFLVENVTLHLGHLNTPRAVLPDVILQLDINLLYLNLTQLFPDTGSLFSSLPLQPFRPTFLLVMIRHGHLLVVREHKSAQLVSSQVLTDMDHHYHETKHHNCN